MEHKKYKKRVVQKDIFMQGTLSIENRMLQSVPRFTAAMNGKHWESWVPGRGTSIFLG